MLTKEKTRVARGIEFLNFVKPKWRSVIRKKCQEGKFDVANREYCPLTILFGSYVKARRVIFSDDVDRTQDYGFTLTFDEDTENTRQALNREWRREIWGTTCDV